MDETRAATLAIADVQHIAGYCVIELLAGRHPEARQQALLREHAPFGGRESIGGIAPLVLEQVPQILIGGDTEQPGAAREASGKLEVGEIGAPVASPQPVLFLGQIIVADASAVQLA